jgi:biopolymer transport protein ExbB
MSTTVYSLFQSGGVFMWPLLLFSILAVTLILERSIQIFLFSKKINLLIEYLESNGKKGKSFFSLTGIDLFAQDNTNFDNLVTQETQLPFDKMFQNLEYLSAISAVAPLLGFIGTVSGMIASFQSIASVNRVAVNLVAGGISEALITTGFGLIIAVVCLSGEHLFRFVLSSLAHKTEKSVTLIERKRFSNISEG